MDTVRCPACGEENPARFRLCGICGTSLLLPSVVTVPCPACGEENPARFRLCGICGTWLRGGPLPGEAAGGGPAWVMPPWGYQPPAWAWYGQPGYPPPGYPPPGPGYAQPGYVQPGYAPPGYAPPGYAPPGYAPQPAYPPVHEAPGSWPAAPAPPHATAPVPAPPPAGPPPAPPAPIDGAGIPLPPPAPGPGAPAPYPPRPPDPIGPGPATTQAAAATPAAAPARRQPDADAFPGFDGAPRALSPAAPLPGSEVRKTVTVIFSDLKGSTALTEKIDAEAINEVKERYFAAMAAEIERHGGKIEKYIGDAIMAVFGLPRAHEDDALRAVRAAHGMMRALERLNRELLEVYGVEIANRTGVNTGEVVANTDPTAEQRLATGDAVNVAARLEQAAPANEVLIGDLTYSLVRSQVEVEAVDPLELKGKAERVPAYRLVSVRDAAAVAEHGADESPLVGRDEQIGRLHDALSEAASLGGCRVVAIVGEAGVGKSHLVDAFHAEVAGRATVLRGRCLPYGDGITFWPLIEMARTVAGIVDDDSPERALEKLGATLEDVARHEDILDRVASVIGLSSTAYPVAEIFWGARKYLEALATRRPAVVIVEDVHHAEATFLDLLEHLLASTSTQASLLVVATGRPLLEEKRPAWSTTGGIATVTVPPLAGEATGRLVEVLLGGAVDEAVTARIVGTAEGNPLFVSQLVSMLVDKGLVRRDEDRWVAAGDLEAVDVPPTIQALLASRLDDLSREERAVMEPAAVIGLAFPQPAVTELVPEPLRPWVPTHLRSLDRKQFVDRPASGGTGEDEVYRFRNIMIRDATYGSLLKRARAQMHERFVTWAERVNRERGREQEFEEILGYHLEQAYRYRMDLGPLDAEGRALAMRAASKLGSAGRRAFGRGDVPAASGLLRRAAALLGTGDRTRVELLCDLADVLMEGGDFTAASAAIDEATTAAAALDDAALVARARLVRSAWRLFSGEAEGGTAAVVEDTLEVAHRFEAEGDALNAARAWRLLMVVYGTTGDFTRTAGAATHVIEAARLAGERRMAARGAVGLSVALLNGDTAVDEALRRTEALMADVDGDRRAEAVILGVRAVLMGLGGAFTDARAACVRGRAELVELGPSVTANATSTESARVELLAGDHAEAEAQLGRDLRALEAMDERYYRSTVAALLAHAEIALGRPADARGHAELSRELADADDVEAQSLARSALALAAAAEGDPATAEANGREAVALAEATANLLLHADALASLGQALTTLGDRETAGPPLREALALYERKGATVPAARVRAMLAGAG